MEAVYSWVKNIIYYMIFLFVISNLLADSKYEKYIRFFAGMVLILLVVSPLTGKLRLNEQISSMFRTISLENDTTDLKDQLWEMDDKRLGTIIGKYEDAVEQDVSAMAKAEGLTCVSAAVHIDSDRNSAAFGRVAEIRMEVEGEDEKKEGSEKETKDCLVNVEAAPVDRIRVGPVELGEGSGDGEGNLPGRGTADRGSSVNEDVTASSSKTAHPKEPGTDVPRENHAIINHLTGKVAEYYGMEESHIKVQWKND